MENNRFDELTRMIASFTSRRSLLRGAAAGGSLLGLGAAGIVPGFGEDADAKKNKNKKKKRKEKKRKKKCKKTCSTSDPCESASCDKKGKCKKKSTDGAGKACEANDECCSGLCACGSLDVDTCLAKNFSQDFEKNLDFWYNNNPDGTAGPPTDAVIERVKSGTDDIPANGGDFFAKVKAGNSYNSETTAFTSLGGYSNVFPDGGYKLSLDVYLDPDAAVDGQVFGYTSALNSTACGHVQDFAFLVGKSGEDFCVGTSTGVANPPNPCNPSYTPVQVTEKGWYTLTHSFAKEGDDTVVTLELVDSGGNTDGSWEITASDSAEPGGNRYGWFAINTFPFVAIDNSTRKS